MLCRLILGFFLVFDCILCSFAELTRFADREFYRDWWNSTVTAYCCLHICRLLSAVTSLLPTVCCLHLCCLLSAVTSLLPAICCLHLYCLLSAVCSLVSSVWCPLSTLGTLCCLVRMSVLSLSAVCGSQAPSHLHAYTCVTIQFELACISDFRGILQKVE